MTDEKRDDPLSEAKRIMGNLARMPHKPHKPHKPPSAPKAKQRAASKGRVRKGKSRS